MASARGERAPRIATYLGIDDQTVLDALHAFNATGLQALQKQSSRAVLACPPHPRGLRTRVVCAPAQAERLRALVHRHPRDLGQPTSLWTLDLAAEGSVAEGSVAEGSVAEGIVPTRVSGETIRATLLRLGISLVRRWFVPGSSLVRPWFVAGSAPSTGSAAPIRDTPENRAA